MNGFLKLAALTADLGGLGWTPPAYAGDGGAFFGTGLGAALGGLVGSQIGRGSGNTAATVTGVVLGGLVGNSIGQSYDNAQRGYAYSSYGRRYAEPAVYYGGAYEPNYVAPYAPAPQQVVYYAPAPRYREIAPAYVTRGYVGVREDSAPYCREYTQRIVIGNQTQESYGTACLQPDGSWRIQR